MSLTLELLASPHFTGVGPLPFMIVDWLRRWRPAATATISIYHTHSTHHNQRQDSVATMADTICGPLSLHISTMVCQHVQLMARCSTAAVSSANCSVNGTLLYRCCIQCQLDVTQWISVVDSVTQLYQKYTFSLLHHIRQNV